jgi:hypothetical protein
MTSSSWPAMVFSLSSAVGQPGSEGQVEPQLEAVDIMGISGTIKIGMGQKWSKYLYP